MSLFDRNHVSGRRLPRERVRSSGNGILPLIASGRVGDESEEPHGKRDDPTRDVTEQPELGWPDVAGQTVGAEREIPQWSLVSLLSPSSLPIPAKPLYDKGTNLTRNMTSDRHSRRSLLTALAMLPVAESSLGVISVEERRGATTADEDDSEQGRPVGYRSLRTGEEWSFSRVGYAVCRGGRRLESLEDGRIRFEGAVWTPVYE